MNEMEAAGNQASAVPPKWKPISSLERRVLGVLAEKAKTTPDQYPLSLNALVNGCNQKSNRSPQMNVEPIQVETALEKLRAMGVVSEVQGGGRVPKYKHFLYEWLGVNKVESAVMIELLLRGTQTVGELRGRAARMEPIDGVSELRPIVRGLIERKLVISLTPEGRGQIVTHGLFLEQEMDKIRREVAEYTPSDSDELQDHDSDDESDHESDDESGRAAIRPAATPQPPRAAMGSAVSSVSAGATLESRSFSADPNEVAQLRQEVAELRDQVGKLKKDIEDLWSNLGG